MRFWYRWDRPNGIASRRKNSSVRGSTEHKGLPQLSPPRRAQLFEFSTLARARSDESFRYVSPVFVMVAAEPRQTTGRDHCTPLCPRSRSLPFHRGSPVAPIYYVSQIALEFFPSAKLFPVPRIIRLRPQRSARIFHSSRNESALFRLAESPVNYQREARG